MAAAGTAFRLCVRSIARQRPTPRLRPATPLPVLTHRTISTTRIQWYADKSEEGSEPGTAQSAANDDAPASEYSFIDEMLEGIPAEERTPELEQELITLQQQLEFQDSKMHKNLDEEAAILFKEPRPLKDSFWFDEDDDDPMTHDVEGEDFDEDDITSMAHGKLDELREYRHFARIAAWEMPLLSKLAKPFEPPKEDEVLRFRYTTYMGESHPAERKVVVTFCPADLGLSSAQELKLKKLAGARYNPERDEIKMSCESFDHQAQNKRYLRDQANRLIDAAKDPADMFEDIPLDLRHHPIKAKPKFPIEWRMTEERRRELDQIRARSIEKDLQSGEKGKLIDGGAVVQGFLNEPVQEREKVPEMVRRRR
ncbi:hypothetical protein jhhlp_006127 [Lomentospora prolificans]|uniref:Small ribosomal subunit protein mS35 mitochondrial conserved domain-containing protein n=1 Tax=Lomentospora prolificans TaxID=41688 RepID=A0A2N3N509_9PEZI|nr:hypothetical protein jhhlp_006127 [Lomentospora prolificans]